MKIKLLLVSTTTTALLLAGCATTGISRREVAGSTYPNYILNLPRTNSLVTRQSIAKPIRLAVAQVGESAPPKAMLDRLESRGDCVASVVGLPAPGEPERPYYYRQQSENLQEKREDFAGRVQSLCRLAKDMGADYLFICGGDMSTWNNPNLLHLFDITIVGAMVFPSTKIQLEGRAAGSLVDAVTGEPILTLSTEAARSKYSPTMFVADRTDGQRVLLRDELTASLADELLERIHSQAK